MRPLPGPKPHPANAQEPVSTSWEFTLHTEELGAVCELHSRETHAQEAAIYMSPPAGCPLLSCRAWEGPALPPSPVFFDRTSLSHHQGVFHSPIKTILYRKREKRVHGSFTDPRDNTNWKGSEASTGRHVGYHPETAAWQGPVVQGTASPGVRPRQGLVESWLHPHIRRP